MPYLVQLLPDRKQAEVLRAALAAYVLEEHTEQEKDAAWALLAELTKKMREAR